MTVEEWVELQERLGMVGDAVDGAALRAEIEDRLRDADARLAERAWRGMVERCRSDYARPQATRPSR